MTLRVVVIGPAENDVHTLSATLSRALADPGTRQVIYLGQDGAATRAVEAHRQLGLSQDLFLAQAVELALSGSPEQVQSLLAAEARGRRLSAVRCLPEPPSRAVEMLERWILLAVFDKAVLDEDDIANTHVILYGKTEQPALARFGPRCFFSPGPLSGGHVGHLELQPNGDLYLQVRDLAGRILQSEVLAAIPAKFVVTP